MKSIEKYFGITLIITILSLFAMIVISCTKEEPIKPVVFKTTPYALGLPSYFPNRLNIPEDNPMTVEGVRLGRYLFYDGRLSGYTGDHPDSLMSCGTCHLQEFSFECGINHPKYTGGYPYGVTGIPTPHVMLPLVNIVFNHEGYFWNGLIHSSNPQPNRRTLEDIVVMGIIAPHEMNSTVERAVAAIQSVPMYPPMFEAAFGTPEINIDRINKAIAQFIRSLVSFNSKFDKYLRGEVQLTDSELRGYILFTTEEGADCFHCHGGGGNPLFTTNLFYNNAKDSVFNDTRDRYAFTRNPKDKGAYKATTLRNIELTGPYMHDGRFKTLDEVIDFYSEGLIMSPYVDPLMHKINDGGALLLPSQKNDLKNFLLTLTDHEFINNPAFSKPADLP
jgi:cytochrome c peroxidase